MLSGRFVWTIHFRRSQYGDSGFRPLSHDAIAVVADRGVASGIIVVLAVATVRAELGAGSGEFPNIGGADGIDIDCDGYCFCLFDFLRDRGEMWCNSSRLEGREVSFAALKFEN